ncbi:hypothetical protein OEV82_02975 [Caldibacillus thermolactis]|jgi:spore coat protein B|uniref:Spore coat protein n=1 Tax=Pallidibacillus thermolactis TaxID=251051 RepID=A0ABT2WCL6_9BACI|nr:hypothetical protein [Pallidibacillus thermolactis]MCU9593418.1 hypothetical protein [Pallidibacillus thermolactis]MCU9601458.1 hypothetical protein [Pallidibacillus thermolactis subsp. kokeshiiformis]
MTKTDFLENLIGREVYINGNANKKGPDALSGTLLDCKKDYMVVYTDKGVQYLRRDHIKTIAENFSNSNNQQNNSNDDVEFLKANSFHDLLKKSRYKYCVVSSGGPNKVQGILEDADENFVSIVTEDEYVRLPLFHVRSINFSVQNNNKNDKNNK